MEQLFLKMTPTNHLSKTNMQTLNNSARGNPEPLSLYFQILTSIKIHKKV